MSEDKKEEAGSADVASAGEEKKDEGAAEAEKTPIDWPLRDISEPHDNDVLYGRGGGTNHHKGNKRYRKMVEDRKVDYVNSKRLDKPMVALEIVRTWRAQDPPGRFLKLDEKTNRWNDVGDRKAREKISQALREKAPQIRKQQEEDRLRKEGKTPEKEAEEKQTTFAPGTTEKDGSGKPVLARDHSLGREYLKDNEEVNLDNFSWQDPFTSDPSLPGGRGGRTSSQGSMGPPPPYNPHVRVGSHSSIGSYSVPPPQGGYHYRYDSHGSVPPPHMQYSHQRVESWSSAGPPPPMPGVAPNPQGSWTAGPDNSLGQIPLPHASVGHAAHYSTFDARAYSGQWYPHGPPPPGDGRIPYHYSGGPPPPNAYPHGPPPPGHAPPSPAHYAPPPGSYASPPPPGHAPPPPPGHAPPPPPGHSPPSPPGHAPPPHRGHAPPGSPASTKSSSKTSSPPYGVDLAVASTWSGQSEGEIVKTWSGEEYDQMQREKQSPRATANSKKGQNPDSMPKPHLVKRMTSNQNETLETKPDLQGPSVKRCALNRDSSRASNRLKELSFPKEFRNGKFDIRKEMNELGQDMEQSRLGSPVPMGRVSSMDMLPPMDELDESSRHKSGAPKPSRITEENRSSTIDDIAMDLMVRPVALDKSGRSTTLEALALDFVVEYDDPVIRSPPGGDKMERLETMESTFSDLRSNPPKPPALAYEDRLTTSDFVNMINEPIPDDDLQGSDRQPI